MTGRSAQLDPRHEPVRRDLADVRLADRVFAPHYAAHLTHVATRATALRAGRDAGTELLATLNAGDLFEALELSAGLAWGSAPAHGLVGYVAASDLGRVA
ncbi:SH3 domain-containing protein [Sphingomonas sp. J315]|nr:SH3 domain-containing protein [Sphingomonas sp. J315]